MLYRRVSKRAIESRKRRDIRYFLTEGFPLPFVAPVASARLRATIEPTAKEQSFWCRGEYFSLSERLLNCLKSKQRPRYLKITCSSISPLRKRKKINLPLWGGKRSLVANRCLCNENGIKSRAHGLIVSIVHDRSRYGTNLVIYCHYCIISNDSKKRRRWEIQSPPRYFLSEQANNRERERERMRKKCRPSVKIYRTIICEKKRNSYVERIYISFVELFKFFHHFRCIFHAGTSITSTKTISPFTFDIWLAVTLLEPPISIGERGYRTGL